MKPFRSMYEHLYPSQEPTFSGKPVLSFFLSFALMDLFEGTSCCASFCTLDFHHPLATRPLPLTNPRVSLTPGRLYFLFVPKSMPTHRNSVVAARVMCGIQNRRIHCGHTTAAQQTLCTAYNFLRYLLYLFNIILHILYIVQ